MKKLLILLIFFMLISCATIFPKLALNKLGVRDTKSDLQIIKNKKQEIAFILMHHVGRKEYYDDVANKVDSLQKLDYTVFYEGVIDKNQTDSLTKKKNLLKLRKIMHFYPQRHEGYIDTTTNIFAGKIKYRGKHKLINQPEYVELNVDSLTSIRADVTLNELITDFEKNNGEIKLDNCDFKFSLKGKNYKCRKAKRSLRNIFKKKYVRDYRDKSLAERIIKSKKNKILVIYGSAHFSGVYFELLSLDKNYRISRK